MATNIYSTSIPHNITQWSVDVFVDVLVCRRFGLSTFWFVDVLVCRRFGLSTFRFVDVLVCRRFGLSTFRFVDVSVCRRLGCRRFGLSTFWPVTLKVNTLRPRQNGRHFPVDSFSCLSLNENAGISNKISLKFVSNGPINNIPAMVQTMSRRRIGDKSLSEAMMA